MRTTRSGGSLRMHSSTAVDAVIGSSPRTRSATGMTATTGSRAKRMIRKPMAAFQKPITYQGKVTAKSTTKTRSTALKPPGESAITASQIRPAIVIATPRKTSVARHAGRAAGAATPTSSRGERSSMKGLWVSFPGFEDIAVGVQVQCGGRRYACYSLCVSDAGSLGALSRGNDNQDYGEDAGQGALVSRSRPRPAARGGGRRAQAG